MPKIYTNTAHCRTLCPPRAAAALVLWMFTISLLAPTSLIASAWNPTLLVNTEAFQIVHEGDSTTDAELRFGDTLNEKIYWDRTNAEFRFSDDIRIDGNITSSGTLTINSATTLKSTLKIGGVTYTFPTSDGSASGKVLKTNSTGQLSWSADGGAFSAGQGITYTNAIVSLSPSFSGTSLEVVGTASGRILRAQDELLSSGSLVVETTTRVNSGVIIARAEDSEFLQIKDTTNNTNIGIHAGSGTPESAAAAGPASLFLDATNGNIYKKKNGTGNTGWVPLYASGSLHMAQMSRAAAQSINNSTWTKIAFDTENHDVGNIADYTTNDRFDIAQSGIYLIMGNFTCQGVDLGEICVSAIYVNGAPVYESRIMAAVTDSGLSAPIVGTLYINAGSYVEYYIYHNAGDTQVTLTIIGRFPFMSVVQLQ